MIRKIALILLLAGIAVAVGCSRNSAPRLVVEIPAGFSGNFVMEMGNKTAAPLQQDGNVYTVTVPRSGKLSTSTVLVKPKVEFRNATDGSIWGLSQSAFTTGDGISVGGKIEFFVGTRKEYEAEENKKNHSGTSLGPVDYPTTGV
jgi:hypothetical protein